MGGSITQLGNDEQVEKLRLLFADYGIAIIFVRTVSGQPDKTGLYTRNLPKTNEKVASKYFLWSSQRSSADLKSSGVGYADAMAQKVGSEMKLLFTKAEFMEIYDKVQPANSSFAITQRKEVLVGKQLPRVYKAHWAVEYDANHGRVSR